MPSRHRLLGILFLMLALLIAGAVVAYAIQHWQPKVAVDASHCPLTPRGTVIAAIDITDIWPPHEQQRIARDILARAEHLAEHERLALHVISGRAEDAAAPWPVPGLPAGFQLCNPVDLTSHWATHNWRFIRADYQRKFLAPLKSALPHLVTGGPAQRSPILQAIEIIMWSPVFRVEIPRRTLVIYSDFLHHMPDMSHLTGSLSDPCEVLASDLGARLKARNWQGVRVVLQYLRNPRDAQRQTPDHRRFWTHLFYLVGAAEVFEGSTPVAREAYTCPPRTSGHKA